MKLKLFCLAVMFFFATTNSYAIFFSKRNLLPGERAAHMGGAYTALSEDNYGTYYNPAGIAYIEQSSLAMTASIYRYSDSERIEKTGSKMSFNSFDFIPSFFSFNLSLKPVSIAISAIQTDYFNFSSTNSDGINVTKIEFESKNYLLGPTIALQLGKSLALGASLFYKYSTTKSSLYYMGELMETNIHSGGLVISTGIKYNIIDHFKIGFNYQAESIYLNGENTYFYTDSGDEYTDTVRGEQGSPHRFALGIAYDRAKHLTLSLDFIYYLKLDYKQPHEMMGVSDPDSHYTEKAHYDISLGMEYFLNNIFSLRFGFFTNTSGAPDEKKSENINIFGGTFGLGVSSGPVSSGIGLSLTYGKSDYQVGSEQMYEARYTSFTSSIIVGGSMMF